MSSIDFISQHQQLLVQLLDGRKELRREMVAYLTALDEVWAKMPIELTAEDRVLLLREITTKFMDELLYSMSMLDKRFDELLVEYNDIDRTKAQDIIKRLSDDLESKESQLYEARLKLENLECNLQNLQTDLLARDRCVKSLKRDHAQALETAQKKYENLAMELEHGKAQAIEQATKYRDTLNSVGTRIKKIKIDGGILFPKDQINELANYLNNSVMELPSSVGEEK